MDAVELLKTSPFELPLKNDTGYLPAFLEEKFSIYLAAIQKFENKEGEVIKGKFKDIKSLCEKIIDSLNCYYQGSPIDAYSVLSEGLTHVEQNLMIPSGKGWKVWPNEDSLFRIRKGCNHLYSREEMFHIPFQSRHKVSTQRYSIPGFPCLYLSNTVYTCWEELNRPDLDNFQAVRFQMSNNQFRILDLSYLPTTFIEAFSLFDKSPGYDYGVFLNYIVTWPLIAACSVTIVNEGNSFIPEYIIPQLLLQWVIKNKNIDGIKYVSTKVKIDFYNHFGSLVNLVIPVKSMEKNGYCSVLKEKFKLTEPITWSLFNIMNTVDSYSTTPKEDVFNRLQQSSFTRPIMRLELIKGRPQDYFQTIFGKMELELCKMNATKID